MPMLKEILLGPTTKERVANDCVGLVDSEVAKKSGLSGIAIKGAYAVVKKVKPGFIREVVDHLLDEFVERLEPFYAAWRQTPSDGLSTYLTARSNEVAEGMLGVTDARAKRAKNATVKKAYEKLRPTAHKHVEAAVPGVAAIVAAYAENPEAPSASAATR